MSYPIRSSPNCFILPSFFLDFISLENAKVLGEGIDCLSGEFFIVDEPVEVISSGRDVVGHGFPEAAVVGDHEEVDHNDIAEVIAVDHLRNSHLAESIQDHKGRVGFGLEVLFELGYDGFALSSLGHREKKNLDRVLVRGGLKNEL